MTIASEQAMAAVAELTLQQDAEMMAALRAVEDRLWSVDEVRRRCSMVRLVSDPFGQETFCIDGVPMIQFFPMTSSMEASDERYMLKAIRPFRRLYASRSSGGE